MRNRKPIIAAVGLVAIVGAIGTYAYFKDRWEKPNIFTLGGKDKIVYTEEFDSPSNWTPCTTTPKTLTIKNESEHKVDVRVKISNEYWEDGTVYDSVSDSSYTVKLENNARFDAGNHLIPADNTTTPTDHTLVIAIPNFANAGDWTYNSTDGWYYYSRSLEVNESTSSFIDSVTFNCDAPIEYGKAKYHLSLTGQTIQSDGRSADPDWN